jgi:hypothetical protein
LIQAANKHKIKLECYQKNLKKKEGKVWLMKKELLIYKEL